ncbi:ABC transporter substrate-binding protein [Desulfitobacterium sp. THU1]|uniref:ABC transporter substrate-binding protein n=1 Tax=Desulfitobacterium sp. THU1 TaxID=3138072 RepID=UPI00311EB1EA
MKIMRLGIIISLIIGLLLTGCSNSSNKTSAGNITNPIEKSWETILDEAKGTTVSFYGWGGDELTNSWIDNYVAQNMQELYGIKVNRVPMGPDEYLNKLLGEKQAGKAKGTIDLLWINGENFRTARQADLLWGPFAEDLPNFQKYVDQDALDIAYDFGYPVEGYEVPWGKAQFVFAYDSAKIQNPPKSSAELLAWVKENPGRFTYPELPDFTGSVFVRHLMYELCGGYESFPYTEEVDKTAMETQLEPLWDYFTDMKSYLWREGTTYPATISALHQLFQDGEVDITMTYIPALMSSMIEQGLVPDTVRTYVWDKGTIGNTHFLAIPFNAPNREAAKVLADFLLSPAAQLSKYEPVNWGDLIALDVSKLESESVAKLESMDQGVATLSSEELQSHSLPEIASGYIPVIEELWKKRVVQNAK